MKKIKKRSKFQKCPKSFPSVQTCLGAVFLEKFFCSVFHGFIESFREIKKIQNRKNAQDRTENCANFFRTCCVAIFQKKRMPRVPWMVGPSKKLKKIKKFWKCQKNPKHSQKCANVFWPCFGAIFSNKLLPSVPWRVESSKNFKNPKRPKIIR